MGKYQILIVNLLSYLLIWRMAQQSKSDFPSTTLTATQPMKASKVILDTYKIKLISYHLMINDWDQINTLSFQFV